MPRFEVPIAYSSEVIDGRPVFWWTGPHCVDTEWNVFKEGAPVIIYAADDPLVLNGTYDQEGYKPGERERIAKARARADQQEGQTSMAKKKSTNRKKQPAKKKDATVAKGARSLPLPGLENVRAGALDNICEGIGDCRDTMNVASVEEKKLIASALKQMQKRNLSVYRHARVELARVPGAEKLRVRLTKEEGDASVEAGAESDGESVEVETLEDDAVEGEGEELRPGVHAEH